MSVEDISTVESLLFGINFLAEGESERLSQVWNSRFSSHTSFLINNSPESDCNTIMTEISKEMRGQGIDSIGGRKCILAVFLDFTKPVSEEQRKTILKLRNVLESVSQCKIQAVMEFCYVGQVGISSQRVQRENTQKLVEANVQQGNAVQHRLCLIATAWLAGEKSHNWKAVCVLLDILRRNGNPMDLLPATTDGDVNNDVAFLRYQEYDEAKFTELSQEHMRLLQLIGSGGEREFQNRVACKREELSREMEMRFPIRGDYQPLHENMIVEPGFMGHNRLSAKKGTNKDFNEARNQSRNALFHTTMWLENEMKCFYKEHIDNADRYLKQFMEEVSLGYASRENEGSMRALLECPAENCKKPQEPGMAYNPEGYKAEIDQYLRGVRDYTVYTQQKAFHDALLTAYLNLKRDQGFEKGRSEAQNRLSIVESKLNSLMKPEDLCKQIAFYSDPAECDFNPITAAGDNRKYLLFRGKEMRQTVDNAIHMSVQRAFQIAENGGGIPQLDTAPLKAVQIVTLDCSENVLQQLLPEVGK